MQLVQNSKGKDANLSVNGREYNWPSRPTVVICIDGCDPTYLEPASKAGATPHLDRMRANGFNERCLAVMPTFTNPNNISIVSGVAPEVHGVGGNFYLDAETGQEVMMLDASLMRSDTILAAFSRSGARVAAITAKDKLRKALAAGLDGIAFSAEKADECTLDVNGITGVEELVGRPVPSQYSADLSLFVLDAGVALMRQDSPDLLYLSLSDYVQHKHAPGTEEANTFMSEIDKRLGQLLDFGAIVGIVADHGMNDMADEAGNPNVLYVGDCLDAAYGEGAIRVICPITDPFVRHHGALGGFVRAHIRAPGMDREQIVEFLRALPQVEMALLREEAAERFQLPLDREGDIVVLGRKGVALGGYALEHDLSQLGGSRLRSHGGLFEQTVPFIISHPLKPDFHHHHAPLRNFDIFYYALNGVA